MAAGLENPEMYQCLGVFAFFMMTYHVYILYSEAFDKYYIGQSKNVFERIHLHNNGSVKSTKPYLPWTIHWYCKKNSRSEAIILERKLKNLNRKRLMEFVAKYESEKL